MEAALIEVGEEWPDKLRLAHEKACLGFYVSGHPLDGYDGEIRRMRCTPLHEIGGVAHRDTVQVAAVVSAMRERPLKSGNGRMAFVTLEDRSGQAEMLVFSQVYGASEEALKADEPLLVEAVVQHEGDADAKTIRLKAEKVQTLREVRRTATRRVRLLIDGDHMTAPRLDRLHQILAVEASDGFPVEAVVAVAGQGQAIVTLGQDYRMGVSDEAITRLERVLGKGTVSFL
jgi:DNA polymerase-3 subunit alpha